MESPYSNLPHPPTLKTNINVPQPPMKLSHQEATEALSPQVPNVSALMNYGSTHRLLQSSLLQYSLSVKSS